MAFPVASFTAEQFQSFQSSGGMTAEINRFAAAHGLTVNISLEADPRFEARVDPSGQIVVWYVVEEEEVPAVAAPLPSTDSNGTEPVIQLLAATVEAGTDLRDVVDTASGPGIFEDDPFTSGLEGMPQASIVALAMRLLMAFMRSPGRITAATWALLPSWAQTTLIQAGIGIGTLITIDMFSSSGGEVNGITGDLPMLPQSGEHLDIPGIHLGAHVIGGWTANGVKFYKLSNGQIAVRRKNGTWKVYRPPKPIVLMPTGSGDLRTLLRADAVITKQAKKIRAMLDRRAPRTRRASKTEQKQEIVVVEGHTTHH